MKVKNPLIDKGADKALIYTTQTRYYDEAIEKSCLIHTIDEDLARQLIATEKMMGKLVKSNWRLFKWPSKPTRTNLPRRGAPRLAHDFLALLRPSLGAMRRAFPRHEFHPLVELFEKHMEAHAFEAGFRPVCKEDVDELNACVEAMRTEGRSRVFQRRRDKHQKGVRNNTQSLLELVDRLFMLHSQLLVVRLDLAYRTEFTDPEFGLSVTEGEAQRDRDLLIEYLRKRCYFKPVGYAWKLEYTEGTKWHMHLLIFFDANRHQRDIEIAKAIAGYWDWNITKGCGRHFICNLQHYVHRGVGKIHYSDTAKLWALRALVVPYITKADYYARPILQGGRTFGRSVLPKIPTRKRGRPRLRPSARIGSYMGGGSVKTERLGERRRHHAYGHHGRPARTEALTKAPRTRYDHCLPGRRVGPLYRGPEGRFRV